MKKLYQPAKPGVNRSMMWNEEGDMPEGWYETPEAARGAYVEPEKPKAAPKRRTRAKK